MEGLRERVPQGLSPGHAPSEGTARQRLSASTKGTGAGLFLGVDVGGSSLKVGAVDAAGAVAFEGSVPYAKDASADEVLGALSAFLRVRLEGRSVVAVGAGLPGSLDREAGKITLSPNLKWLLDVPMRDELARRLALAPGRVHLENDANVAALGEQRFGGGVGMDELLFLTLGTGIGSGLILGGELFVGRGLASEAGHIVVDPEGLPCGCGGRGHLETLASATAARRRAIAAGLPAEEPGNLERLTAHARAAAGPERDLLEAVGRDLGHGLASVLVLLDVRTYVFGGGFAAALDVMEPGIRLGVRERCFPDRPYELLPAHLGNRAGWLGAAALAQRA